MRATRGAPIRKDAFATGAHVHGYTKPPILVVTDENGVAMDLVSSLKNLDYPVVGVAATGEEAISLVETGSPGLVLVDVHLRGKLDGIRTVARIQERLFVPVIYVAAHSEEATLVRARVTQPFGCILKPFDDREIDVAIQFALLRHEMGEALRNSERRLEATLSSIGDAVIATDTSKRITFINRAAERLLEWTTERAKGRLLSDVLDVSSRGERPLRLNRAGMAAVPVELVESPVLDLNGTPTGYVTVARDVSERLLAEEAHDRELIERAARVAAEKERERARIKGEISLALGDITESADQTPALRHVARLISHGLATWCSIHVEDGTLTIQVASHADPNKTPWAEELSRRWPADPSLPRGICAVMRSGKAEWMRDIPDELLVQTAQDHEHLALLRKLGMASYVCVPLRARKGVVGALSLVSGEADRRYDESDVAFAQQVADRIALAIDNARLFRETQEAKVAAERLYEAEQKARAEAAAAEARQAGLVRELERAVRFSDMFVGILGHDLRNPLSGITTAASLVLSRADSERVTKPLSRILSSADRMSRMIDQVLDFTRIRLGRGIPLQQQAVDLAELCRNVVDELKSEGERGTAFRLEVRGDTRGVWDEDRLAQLVSNLAGNAFQHRQHDAPVTVSVDGTAPDVVALTVHNLGGIPQEILPVIFEPLRSGEHRKRKGSSGLGLGLYISQQIVIAHGGVIRAESADDETRFMLALPRTPPSGGEQVFGSSGQKDASSE